MIGFPFYENAPIDWFYVCFHSVFLEIGLLLETTSNFHFYTIFK